ncbi:alpha/beta hydrolase [Acidobacteriota bacterium]
MKNMKLGFGITGFLALAVLSFGLITSQEFQSLHVVHKVPDIEKVRINHGNVYKSVDGKELTFDAYYPPESKREAKLPVVIMVLGYADNVFSQPLKDFEVYKDWAKLFAASGMAAINYSTLQPASDIHDLIRHIREKADAYGFDPDNIGVWSCSANVITALTLLWNDRQEYLKCASLYYGLMLTPDKKFNDTVMKLSEQVSFSTVGIEEIKHFHQDLPLFIVRAGRDREDFNQAIDYFGSQAISHNVPLTFINYAEGRHAFDVYDDNDTSRDIIQQTLNFMRRHLLSN